MSLTCGAACLTCGTLCLTCGRWGSHAIDVWETGVRQALDDGSIVEDEFQGELPAAILDAACLDFVFDPVAVLGRLADLYRGVIDLELVRADPEAMEALAFVEFFPATESALRRTVLHVSSHIWELAEEGDEDARALLAHEIGRIVSHTHRAFDNHEAMAG